MPRSCSQRGHGELERLKEGQCGHYQIWCFFKKNHAGCSIHRSQSRWREFFRRTHGGLQNPKSGSTAGPQERLEPGLESCPLCVSVSFFVSLSLPHILSPPPSHAREGMLCCLWIPDWTLPDLPSSKTQRRLNLMGGDWISPHPTLVNSLLNWLRLTTWREEHVGGITRDSSISPQSSQGRGLVGQPPHVFH